MEFGKRFFFGSSEAHGLIHQDDIHGMRAGPALQLQKHIAHPLGGAAVLTLAGEGAGRFQPQTLSVGAAGLLPDPEEGQIGRASCRERV